MENKHRIAFYIFFLVIIVMMGMSMCGTSPNDHLDKALLQLDSAQRRLDTALVKIDDTKILIDSMRADFTAFGEQMNLMKADVQQVNRNSKSSEQLFKSSIKDMKLRNQKVMEQLKIQRDSLPEIKIY